MGLVGEILGMTDNQHAMLRAIGLIENQVTAMLETLKELDGVDQDRIVNARYKFHQGFSLAKDAMIQGEIG